MGLIQKESEMLDLDLNMCDEDTLKRLSQQNMVQKILSKFCTDALTKTRQNTIYIYILLLSPF